MKKSRWRVRIYKANTGNCIIHKAKHFYVRNKFIQNQEQNLDILQHNLVMGMPHCRTKPFYTYMEEKSRKLGKRPSLFCAYRS
jgi:hypothetical protein